MTLCNMAIEAGARAGIVAVDETTIEYIKGRPYAPKGLALLQAMQYWRTLHSDTDAKFDAVVELRLNNATGTIVPFDATISGNVISVSPLSTLAVNQTYYVALLANTIEDLNNNGITAIQSVVFTTANPSISFASNFIKVNENHGTLSLILNFILQI